MAEVQDRAVARHFGWANLRFWPIESCRACGTLSVSHNGLLHMNADKSSVCPLDCPDTCSLSVTVADDQVIAVRGSKVNPITHGAICAKVANLYPEFVHGPNRLRHPLKRVGAKGDGSFARISWGD